ncbi:MAG: hypothetical protein K8F25_13195, partial [Fimbriimonadaceae bacterium]|nr:hypothetical protein [Alphaproteobacteria bacterium]
MENRQFPTSIDEAADLLQLQITEDEKAEIVAIGDESDLARFHFSLGLYVRNHFGLWSEDSELMKKADWSEDADDISHQIIVCLWQKLRAAH